MPDIDLVPITMPVTVDPEQRWWEWWPEDSYGFGRKLGEETVALLPVDHPLRHDLRFIEDMMRAVLRAIERHAGQQFNPQVDISVIQYGAGFAIGKWGRARYDNVHP